MILSCLQRWDESLYRLVYEAAPEVKTEAPKAEKVEGLAEIQYDPAKKTEDEVWQGIDEQYGKDPYQALITKYVDEWMPTEPEGFKSGHLASSLNRYLTFYERTKKSFMETAKDLKTKFDVAVDRLRGQVKNELSVLKSAVEGAKPMAEFKEPMPLPENPRAVRDHFSHYLTVLKGRYFNVSANEGYKVPRGGIPILSPFIHADSKTFDKEAHPQERVGVPIVGPVIGSDVFKGVAYKNAAKKFQDGMERWVDNKVNWHLQKGTTQQELQAFRDEVTARYELYSKLDGNTSIVSGSDLATLEAVAFRQTPDAVGRVLEERDDQTLKRMEVMHLLNPDGWECAVQSAGDIIIREAINNGSTDKFVAAMNKMFQSRGADIRAASSYFRWSGQNLTVTHFASAKHEFKILLSEISKVGVTETMAFLKEFNHEVHGDLLQFEKAVEPPALAYQVDRQMDYLLKGILTPEKDTDRMLTRFMSASLNERKDMLDNPGTRDTLFRAIRQATDEVSGYPAIYAERFKSVSEDPSKLRTSRRIEKPTNDDKAAQLQALIILGNQAKVIVMQLSRSPRYVGKGFEEEMFLAPIPEDVKAVELGGFKGDPQPARFRSALDHGGFNGRDLALKGAKVLGALTVVANVFQSYSETSGEFMDRVTDTVEKVATNQGVIAGAAVAVGSHLAERNHAFLKYPWLSPHERSSVMTAFKLDNLAAKIGRDEVNRFLGNNAEWRALASPSLDPESIKGLLKQAGEQAEKGDKPIITKDNLRTVIKDESIISTLTTGGRSGRMRYLFYESFFASSVKPDVNHVRELCTGSSYISPSPVKIK